MLKSIILAGMITMPPQHYVSMKDYCRQYEAQHKTVPQQQCMDVLEGYLTQVYDKALRQQ